MPDFEWPDKATEQRKLLASQILWTLFLEGDIEDKANAIEPLMDSLATRGVRIEAPRLSFVLKELSSPKYRGMVHRTINGRRTQGIHLMVPEEKLPPNPFAGVSLDDLLAANRTPDPEPPDPPPVDPVAKRQRRKPTRALNGPEATEFEWPSVNPMRRRLVTRILWCLYLDGPIHVDANATQVLIERLRSRGVHVLSSDRKGFGMLLKEMAGGRYGELVIYDGPKINNKNHIELLLDPDRLPDPNPFTDSTPEASTVTTTTSTTVDVEPYEPAPTPEPQEPTGTITDKILFSISLLTEAIVQYNSEPAQDLTAMVAAHVGPALAVLEENQRLRSEVEELRTEKFNLQRTVGRLQTTIEQLNGSH